ncbi:MAG: indole-3-glycerol-phosphate synthase [bacterium]|nr:indole-3-glycerol-phosphate synthase [bacterium]MDT8366415.1 indole-3-glycerol-phosphate synthase [bacterium]
MSSFLEKAAVSARSNLADWKRRFPDPAAMDRVHPPVFLPPGGDRCGVIAEVKRRSPSRGDIMGQADPVTFPGYYTRGGAEAVSVVVEEQYFGGSPELFGEIFRHASLPLLWKDFVVDPYQIHLAAGLGASAVLLIAGMLSDAEMTSYMGIAREDGLRALVEVHDGAELERAVDAGADLIGVNNRNLITLQVDIEVSEQLAGKLPPGVQSVSESGIRTPEDVARMATLGYRAVLVGESLVTAENTGKLLEEMVEAGKHVRA